jgi:hypothetical protein
MSPITRKLLAVGAVASMAVGGAAGVAQARHGADDPVGHDRGDDHGARIERGDDNGGTRVARHRHRHHRAHDKRREDRRHVADDAAGDDHGTR